MQTRCQRMDDFVGHKQVHRQAADAQGQALQVIVGPGQLQVAAAAGPACGILIFVVQIVGAKHRRLYFGCGRNRKLTELR